MVVHLVSPDGRYDPVYLRNYALLNVRNELARLPGAGQVVVFGAGDYAMRVWLDPNKVASRNLSGDRRRPGDTRAEPAGRGRAWLAQPPMPNPQAYQLTVRARGRLVDEAEFGNIIVKTGENGEVTRLRDLARIELGAGDFALRALLNNKSAVACRRLPGARLQCARALQLRPREDGRAQDALSARRRLVRGL
jgi:multidrug efflux pump subunit AcrB